MFRRTSAAAIRNAAESVHSPYFSRDTMRFFNSRLLDSAVYVSEDGLTFLFVTSERFDDESPRLYTARVASLADGWFDVSEVEGTEFQQFKTSTAAAKVVRELASK